ncbi:hypothetical protein ACFRAE_10285 [Sphingobacterium sp. HJSM2_6]|uniref:hypothetical protein n=1 Tax=Sphingobacterium sp. HJSM2_6 TaxID=3366264 RepID=UPI003BD5B74D
MSLHKNAALKEAVLNLSNKEKDKLLVRLINKDKMLLKQLHFELLEDESDLENRILDLKANLEAVFDNGKSQIKNIPLFSNYRELTRLIRTASGLVNEHEKVTKDKFSVVECRLMILQEAFEQYASLFKPASLTPGFKLQQYVKGRIKNALSSYEKLHEDLQFDLKDPMEYVLDFAEGHRLNS